MSLLYSFYFSIRFLLFPFFKQQLRIVPRLDENAVAKLRTPHKERLPRHRRDDHALLLVVEAVARLVDVKHVLHVGRGQLENKAILTVLNDRRGLAAQFFVRIPIGDILRGGDERAVILADTL